MVAQDIYLSPRNILNHLRDIEKKLPPKAYTLYSPSVSTVDVVPDELLRSETKRMIDFVGLNSFDAEVRYVKLEDGVGGNISLNNSSERILHINISDTYRRNWAATLSVLAHEICHKVLYVHGLYVPIESQNEVYTDLATIYVGFGELILKGYYTRTTSGTHILGYLTPQTYKVTYSIVQTVYGKRTAMISSNDGVADAALERWQESEDKQQILRTLFIKTEEQMAEFSRHIQLLEGLLKQCRADMAYDFDKLDERFFKAPYDGKDTIKYPLAAFSAIYEYEFYEKSKHIEKLNKAVNDALYSLYLAYQEDKHYEIRCDFTCPFCGFKGKNTSIKDRITVVKCPSCSRHYTFDARSWNVSSHQRELNAERKQKEQKDNDAIKKYKREINEAASAVANEKINKAREKATIEIEEIRSNEQQRAKQTMLMQIPLWLRWIVKRFLNQE